MLRWAAMLLTHSGFVFVRVRVVSTFRLAVTAPLFIWLAANLSLAFLVLGFLCVVPTDSAQKTRSLLK